MRALFEQYAKQVNFQPPYGFSGDYPFA